MNEHLKGLNQKQKEAVTHTDGPLLVLAGAGAGKTRVLTHRILHLIHQGIDPHKILAITFTNKAAKEMRERVYNLLKSDQALNRPVSEFSRPFVSTFHSLGVHILKEQHRLLDVPKQFTIFDRSDSKKIVKQALKDEDLDPKQYEPGRILSIISREKGNMVTADEYEAESQTDFIADIVGRVWKRYDKALQENKAFDFDDLLLQPTLLLKKNKEVREYYQNIWSHIHIDEYQDTNKVQYELAKMFVENHKNICVVGDIDQNIYSWRGATIENILNFERDYPEVTNIVLEQNYRSTQTILSAANDVIKQNKRRVEKNMFTQNNDGEKILCYTGFDENDEARFVVEEAQELINSGVDPSQIAVLYRANFQSRILEENFLERQIPYQVLGTRFFDRKEVKDVLSFLRAARNPKDLTNLGRIINIPPRGIGKVTYLKICEGREGELKGKSAQSVADFFSLLRNIKTKSEKEKPSEVIKYIVKASGLEASLQGQGDDGLERLENIKELASLATKYDIFETEEALEKFLEDAALASDQDELEKDNGGVKLMTVHASKGLEFDYVFITGLEEGLFPHERLNQSDDHDDEEERRLFYVALTRAGKKLYLSYATMRTVFGSQTMNMCSSFIHDIDPEYLERPEDSDPTNLDSKFDGIDNDPDDPLKSDVKNIFIDF